MKKILPLCCILIFTGCTSVEVKPIDPELNITHVCIRDNPKVIVEDFLFVVRDRFDYHGISTSLFSQLVPDDCEYVLNYTAFKTWDFATYLHHAELRMIVDGLLIGSATYHLNGKGGFSMFKWQGTKTKMDPVIDELLGKVVAD